MQIRATLIKISIILVSLVSLVNGRCFQEIVTINKDFVTGTVSPTAPVEPLVSGRQAPGEADDMVELKEEKNILLLSNETMQMSPVSLY